MVWAAKLRRFRASAVACDEDNVCWADADFDVVVEGELLGFVFAKSECFCDFAGSLCALCGAGLVADVKRERGCLAVVGAFEFGDLEFFSSACHRVSPWVLCLAVCWRIC